MIDLAYAMGPAPVPSGGSPWVQFLQSPLPVLVVMGGIFFFLVIRPQQRERQKREAMLGSLKKGDRVITSGGLIGTIVGLSDQTVILKIADSVRVECLRSAINGLRDDPKASQESA